MNFVALDLETANEDFASICQVGIVKFRDGQVVEKYTTLVNPEDDFSGRNISIHGILPEHVEDAPLLSHIHHEIVSRLNGEIVVTHTPFDKASITRGFNKYQLDHFECRWLDSARVVRRVWLERTAKGYGLAQVAAFLGIEFNHHDACEDARAAGEIVMRAITESSIDITGWLTRSYEPVGGKDGGIAQLGNPDGPLYGEHLVFTGELKIVRRDAAKMAGDAGICVSEGINQKTTLLVVGDQDLRILNGQEKSSKHRKAENLISKGQSIRIMSESDFRALIQFS